MVPLKFNWEYIAGIKTAQHSLKKYRDEDTGAVKEIFTDKSSDTISYLYYIPSDSMTVKDEDHLIKRIDTLLQQNKMKRVNHKYDGKYSKGTFKFYNSIPVFSEVKEEEQLNNLFENGKIAILRI